jgi:hypothetical protein
MKTQHIEAIDRSHSLFPKVAAEEVQGSNALLTDVDI